MINENIVIAIVVSVAPTLAVIGSTFVGLKTAKEQNKKLKQIHFLTNESFSKAMDKIDRLEKIIKDKEAKE
jgi:hypothetical protein